MFLDALKTARRSTGLERAHDLAMVDAMIEEMQVGAII